MIHYYEDEHDELYNLDSDPGEKNNIITDHKTKATELHQRLDIWLSEVDAKFPVLDSEYVPEKEQARLHKLEHEFMPKLEVEHAEYLNPNWQPNEDWWGSQVTID